MKIADSIFEDKAKGINNIGPFYQIEMLCQRDIVHIE